jgi:hypothetical protein
MDQFPPGIHSVVNLFLPVANSWPTGQVKVTVVPNAVSRLEARAPSPGLNVGQSTIDFRVLFCYLKLQICNKVVWGVKLNVLT